MENFESQSFKNAEKDFFDKLPEEEKKKRLEENPEGATEQYGFELAMKSRDMEKELTPEEKEEFEKLKLGASNVIKLFTLKRSPDNKKGENLVVIADSGVDDLMLKALYGAGREAVGDDCRVIIVPKTEHPKQALGKAVGEKMQTADAVLLLTSLSRSHSPETRDAMHPLYDEKIIEDLLSSEHLKRQLESLRSYTPKELKNRLESMKKSPEAMFPSKARFISITSSRREMLNVGGALENIDEMAQRIDKFAEKFEGVRSVHITSEDGTDLNLVVKPNTAMKETGIIDKPGQGSNFPTGEFSMAVEWSGTKGVYVANACATVVNRLAEPIKITFKEGLAVNVEGGKEAVDIKTILDKANREYAEKNPDDKKTNAYRAAEFSFGMNSKAFRLNEEGEKISAPVLLEAEKLFGSVHIALGANGMFNIKKDDPGYNDPPIHIDFVAMNISVTGIKEDGTEIELIKNGRTMGT